MGSKTPFKDIEDDNDIQNANNRLVMDGIAIMEDLFEFLKQFKIERTSISFDDLLPISKKKELGLL